MDARHQGVFCAFLLLLLFHALPLCGGTVLECEELVDRVLPHPPPFRLLLRAGAKTTETLEARGRLYTGVFFELPLVDPGAAKRLRARRQEREELFRTIAALKAQENLLFFKRDLLEYHRQRLQRALEDNEAFLRTKEEILKIEGEIQRLESRLKAYGIDPKEARTCRW